MRERPEHLDGFIRRIALTGARTGARIGARTGARIGARTGARTGARAGARNATYTLIISHVRASGHEAGGGWVWLHRGLTTREIDRRLGRLIDRSLD